MSSEIPLGYDVVWQKVMQTLVLEGITLSTNNKELGIIQGSKTCGDNTDYFACKRIKGRIESNSVSISITINQKTDSSSVVSITVVGHRKSYRNKRKGTVKT